MGPWLDETASSIQSACRSPPPHSVSYLFQITAVSRCVRVKPYCTRPPRISSDCSRSPFPSHLLLRSCPFFVLFFFRESSAPSLGFRCWESNRSAEGKKKGSLIEYWSGIVRQAQMTQVRTWEQGSGPLCIFCCNQLRGAKRCIHQSGITWPCHHRGELRSCGHRSCQNACVTVATVMELSNPRDRGAHAVHHL